MSQPPVTPQSSPEPWPARPADAADAPAETATQPGAPASQPPDDPELASALAAASQRPTGPSRVTLGLAGALLVVGGFGGGYVVGNQTAGDDNQASERVWFPGGLAPSGPDGSQPGEGGAIPGVGDFTAGTITKIDGDTVTIKTAAGDEVTVRTDSGTDVTIIKDGTVGDLSTGDPVVVSGNRHSDGSISADSISEGNNRFALTPGAGT
jgi:Domain of unknown function (DUF5666)